MAILNKNNISPILNEILTEVLGDAASEVDVNGIVDSGLAAADLGTYKDQFTKSLIAVLAKNWMLDSSYRSVYKDPFYTDEAEYGALTQAIKMDLVTAEDSLNWQNFGDGVGEVSTVGTYKVRIPKFNTKVMGKSVSFQVSITVTGTQWDSAVRSGAGVIELANMVLMVLDNSYIVHMENLNRVNRNTLIAKNINGEKTSVPGVHAINLVELFVQEAGDASQNFTVEEYLNSPKALLHGGETFRLYKNYMKDYTKLFNLGEHDSFVPDNRFFCQVLSKFNEQMNTIALSDVYHKEIVELPNFQEVNFWQAPGTSYAWDDISKINIKLEDGTSVEQDGIVAVMGDRWVCAHTLVQERTPAKTFEPEDLTNYYKQNTSRYQNLADMLNSVVFYLADYTA